MPNWLAWLDNRGEAAAIFEPSHPLWEIRTGQVIWMKINRHPWDLNYFIRNLIAMHRLPVSSVYTNSIMLKENKMPYVQVGTVSSDGRGFQTRALFSLHLRQVFSPNGKLEQMLKLIDPANEMAVAEFIRTHHTNYTCALHNKAGIDGGKETGINDCSRTN